MVVIQPRICENSDNYRLCLQVIKEIYSLRYELVFAHQKQDQIQKRINDLTEWRNSKLNNTKWEKVRELIDTTQLLQKQRKEIFDDIRLSKKLRYADALKILSVPEIQEEILDKLDFQGFKNISIRSIAALISQDGPKELRENLVRETREDMPELDLEKKSRASKLLKKHKRKKIAGGLLPGSYSKTKYDLRTPGTGTRRPIYQIPQSAPSQELLEALGDDIIDISPSKFGRRKSYKHNRSKPVKSLNRRRSYKRQSQFGAGYFQDSLNWMGEKIGEAASGASYAMKNLISERPPEDKEKKKQEWDPLMVEQELDEEEFEDLGSQVLADQGKRLSVSSTSSLAKGPTATPCRTLTMPFNKWYCIDFVSGFNEQDKLYIPIGTGSNELDSSIGLADLSEMDLDLRKDIMALFSQYRILSLHAITSRLVKEPSYSKVQSKLASEDMKPIVREVLKKLGAVEQKDDKFVPGKRKGRKITEEERNKYARWIMTIDVLRQQLAKISDYNYYGSKHNDDEADKLIDKITKFIESGRRPKKTVDEISKKFQPDILQFYGFKPRLSDRRSDLSHRVVNFLMERAESKSKLQEYKEANKTYWGLTEATLDISEKIRTKLFKTDTGTFERAFVESIVGNIAVDSEKVKDLNKKYNKELEHLNVFKENTKQSCQALTSSIESQQEMFEVLQNRNIKKLSDQIIDNLDLWKRVLGPKTIAKIIKYANTLSRYLRLVNEVLASDPSENDVIKMATYFSTREEFDAIKYVRGERNAIDQQIEALKDYLQDWKTYENSVRETLQSLFSDEEAVVQRGLFRITSQLERERPPVIFGMDKKVSEHAKKLEKYAELVARARKALEREDNTPEQRIKLRNYIKKVQAKAQGLEELPAERNIESIINQATSQIRKDARMESRIKQIEIKTTGKTLQDVVEGIDSVNKLYEYIGKMLTGISTKGSFNLSNTMEELRKKQAGNDLLRKKLNKIQGRIDRAKKAYKENNPRKLVQKLSKIEFLDPAKFSVEIIEKRDKLKKLSDDVEEIIEDVKDVAKEESVGVKGAMPLLQKGIKSKRKSKEKVQKEKENEGEGPIFKNEEKSLFKVMTSPPTEVPDYAKNDYTEDYGDQILPMVGPFHVIMQGQPRNNIYSFISVAQANKIKNSDIRRFFSDDNGKTIYYYDGAAGKKILKNPKIAKINDYAFSYYPGSYTEKIILVGPYTYTDPNTNEIYTNYYVAKSANDLNLQFNGEIMKFFKQGDGKFNYTTRSGLKGADVDATVLTPEQALGSGFGRRRRSRRRRKMIRTNNNNVKRLQRRSYTKKKKVRSIRKRKRRRSIRRK